MIGLKVKATKNDPSRELTDMADIETLLLLHGKHLDWTLIEEYVSLFTMDDYYKRL